MDLPLLIRSEAEADIDEAYRWYEDQQEGLGAEFVKVLEDAFAKIRTHPEMYPLVHRNAHRLLIPKFPYGIFYIVEPEAVIVFAVFHGHRDPRRLKNRS